MSILNENIEPQITYVGHMFDVHDRSYDEGLGRFNTNPIGAIGKKFVPDWNQLTGLLGHRQSNKAYAVEFKRYVIAAFLTCYVSESGIHVHDNRFNKIIRMVNKLYGLPMGTLEVEFDLKPGTLKMYHKDQLNKWTGIVNFQLTAPDIFRGLKPAYYVKKPGAIKTGLKYVERLLNYDIENNILNQ